MKSCLLLIISLAWALAQENGCPAPCSSAHDCECHNMPLAPRNPEITYTANALVFLPDHGNRPLFLSAHMPGVAVTSGPYTFNSDPLNSAFLTSSPSEPRHYAHIIYDTTHNGAGTTTYSSLFKHVTFACKFPYTTVPEWHWEAAHAWEPRPMNLTVGAENDLCPTTLHAVYCSSHGQASFAQSPTIGSLVNKRVYTNNNYLHTPESYYPGCTDYGYATQTQGCLGCAPVSGPTAPFLPVSDVLQWVRDNTPNRTDLLCHMPWMITTDWSTNLTFTQCACDEGYFSPDCHLGCPIRCNGHSLTPNGCAHDALSYSATEGCDCELGWRAGAEPTDPFDPLFSVNKRMLNGQPYLCTENTWHKHCDLAHTEVGIDNKYGPGTFYCACKPGWGGAQCDRPCPSGCVHCEIFTDKTTLCVCSGHGRADPVADICVCDEGYGGMNCNKLLPDPSSVPLDVQVPPVANVDYDKNENAHGVPESIGVTGIRQDAGLCEGTLAFNHSTARCSFGFGWDAFVNRTWALETTGHWYRRIAYGLFGKTVPVNASRLVPMDANTRVLSNRNAIELCRTSPSPLCGDRSDEQRIVYHNQVLTRGALLNCTTIDTFLNDDVLECWRVCTTQNACLGVQWDARTGRCWISLESTCTLRPAAMDYYAAVKADVLYRDARPLPNGMVTLPSYHPARLTYCPPPMVAMPIYNSTRNYTCVCPHSLSFNFTTRSCVPSPLRDVWMAREDETTMAFARRVIATLQPTVPLPPDEFPPVLACGSGPECRTYTRYATDFCAYFQSYGANPPGLCVKGVAVLPNSLFQPGTWILDGGTPSGVTLTNADPVACVRSVLGFAGHVRAVTLRVLASTKYECAASFVSGHVGTGTLPGTYVWVPDKTSYMNSFENLYVVY